MLLLAAVLIETPTCDPLGIGTAPDLHCPTLCLNWPPDLHLFTFFHLEKDGFLLLISFCIG